MMKFFKLFVFAAPVPMVFAAPLDLDINVHIDIQETSTTYPESIKAPDASSAVEKLALPIINLGYERHQASPDIKVGCLEDLVPTKLIELGSRIKATTTSATFPMPSNPLASSASKKLGDLAMKMMLKTLP